MYCLLLRGAIVGGGGGVEGLTTPPPPPEFWVDISGWVDPPLILKYFY